MIPKIIHYCWLSGDAIPEKLQKCMDSWKDKLPDYEFMLWDLNRFDINQSLWVKQAFEAKKYAFAADYIRLYAVYHYGGIYLDMDVEVLKSFNPLLKNDSMLAYETVDGIEAGVFGSIKHGKWVEMCLKYYENREFVISEGVYDIKSLPSIIFDVFREQKVDLQIYSNDYFTAKSYKTGKITRTSNTYCIHHFAGSWLPFHKRLKIQIMQMLGEKGYNFLRSLKYLLTK